MRAARAPLEPPLDGAGGRAARSRRHLPRRCAPWPAGVREASRLIRQINPTTGVKPFELCNVGDAPTDPLNVVRSVALIQEFFERIHSVGAAPLAVGGDHTVPLGSDPDVGQRSAMPMRWRVSGSFGGRSVHPDGGVATKARPRRRLIVKGFLSIRWANARKVHATLGIRGAHGRAGRGIVLSPSAARMGSGSGSFGAGRCGRAAMRRAAWGSFGIRRAAGSCRARPGAGGSGGAVIR